MIRRCPAQTAECPKRAEAPAAAALVTQAGAGTVIINLQPLVTRLASFGSNETSVMPEGSKIAPPPLPTMFEALMLVSPEPSPEKAPVTDPLKPPLASRLTRVPGVLASVAALAASLEASLAAVVVVDLAPRRFCREALQAAASRAG